MTTQIAPKIQQNISLSSSPRNTADSMTLNPASWWWYAHINIRFSYRKNTTSPVHAVLLSTKYSATTEDTFDPHQDVLF